MPEIKYSAVINMAVCRLNEGEYACSIECSEYAIRHRRFLFEAHFIKGCALFFSEQYKQSQAEFEKTLKYVPQSEECIFNLCAAAVKNKAYDFCRLAEKYKDNAGLVMLNAIALYEQGKKSEAREQFAKVHEMRPEYATAFTDEGAVLLEDGEYDEAVACFDKALSLSPLNKYALYNRARANFHRNKLEMAKSDVETLLIIDGADDGFVFLYAEIDEALGNNDDAQIKYEKCALSKNLYIADESKKKLSAIINKNKTQRK